MSFPTIHGPSDPEEFSWEVRLGEDQSLERLDERHAAVVYQDGTVAFLITAEQAHDANGTAVPTDLFVPGEKIVTLVVHHRAGDQAAGGVPFVYPVTPGAPYEVGYSAGTGVMLPPEALPRAEEKSEASVVCTVPKLRGPSLEVSRHRARAAGCKIDGVVRRPGASAKVGRVVGQNLMPGTVLPAWTGIAVTLGAPRPRVQ
jgi:hypothetical protein